MEQDLGLSASLLLLGIIIFICVLLNSASTKRGIPMLLAFIVFGMLCGNIGGIPIFLDDQNFASQVCTVALIFIMFYGGFGTRWKTARCVAVESGLLATLGVFVTAVITGIFCHLVLKWSWTESLLLGAVVSSTDAASVFSVLRSNKLGLKNNTSPLLEIESGSNDPAAFMLTTVMISIINGSASAGHIVWMVIAQIFIGAICGLVIAQLGIMMMRRGFFPTPGFDSILVFAIAIASYALPDMIGGNGYLSAYIVGIIMGNNSFPNRKRLIGFFDGINGLMQMIIFFMLGLLARPALLVKAFLPAVAISAALLLIARPAAVAAILTPFKKYSMKQQGLITFAGLRGASAIVFAIVAASECDILQNDIFSTIFCVVLISISIEGTFIPKVAHKLGMIDTNSDVMVSFTDFEDETSLHFSKIKIEEGTNWASKAIKDVKLPKGMLISRVEKADPNNPEERIRIIPDGETLLEVNDIVIVCSQAYISDKEMRIVQVQIGAGSRWKGKSIAEYSSVRQNQVLMIQRGDENLIPDGKTVLEADDVLYINSNLAA